MAKISEKEYEFLKGLDDKWKWVARDKDDDSSGYQNEIYIYEVKPKRSTKIWFGGKGSLKRLDIELFQFIQWEDEEPHNIAELIDEYEYSMDHVSHVINETVKALGNAWKESEETEVKDMREIKAEPKNITLQDVTHRLWELALNDRKYWLEQLNSEFQEGYVVPLGLKTTDGEEQYLTFNGSYFASRRNRHLQQTFATLEEIPEFYRDLAERVL